MRKSINCPPNKYFRRPLILRPALAWLGVLAAAILTAGCLSSGPAGRKNMVESPKALELARRLYAQSQEIKSITAKGSLRYQEKSRQHFIRFDLAAQRPGKLMFTAYDPAGRPALRLYVNGSELTAIDYLNREIISGPATPRNLTAFLPLGLSPDQLIIALAGGQPIAQPVKAASAIAGGDKAAINLDIWSQGDTGQNYWRYRLAPGGDLEVASAQYGPLKNPYLSFQYQGYQMVSGQSAWRRVPHSITVAAGQGDRARQATIRYDQLAIDEHLPAALFEPPLAEGFKPVNLSDALAPESL